MRTCTKCKSLFPASAEYYHRRGAGKVGFAATCKKCRNKMARERCATKTGAEASRNAQLKYAYGLTLDEWNDLFAAQRGCCAICGVHQVQLKKRLAVDHNHETGKVRALLCQPCNRGLGHFRDDFTLVMNAANYLEQHAQ